MRSTRCRAKPHLSGVSRNHSVVRRRWSARTWNARGRSEPDAAGRCRRRPWTPSRCGRRRPQLHGARRRWNDLPQHAADADAQLEQRAIDLERQRSWLDLRGPHPSRLQLVVPGVVRKRGELLVHRPPGEGTPRLGRHEGWDRPKPGPAPGTAPAKDRTRARVIELRRAGLSTYEIAARLPGEGTPLNRTSVAEILAEEARPRAGDGARHHRGRNHQRQACGGRRKPSRREHRTAAGRRGRPLALVSAAEVARRPRPGRGGRTSTSSRSRTSPAGPRHRARQAPRSRPAAVHPA